jgi:hypothetical protein
LTPASAVTFSLFKEHKRTHENDTTKDGKNDTNTKLKLKQKKLKINNGTRWWCQARLGVAERYGL